MSHENRRLLRGTSIPQKHTTSYQREYVSCLESSLSGVNPLHTTTCVIISRGGSVQITGFCVGACN